MSETAQEAAHLPECPWAQPCHPYVGGIGATTRTRHVNGTIGFPPADPPYCSACNAMCECALLRAVEERLTTWRLVERQAAWDEGYEAGRREANDEIGEPLEAAAEGDAAPDAHEQNPVAHPEIRVHPGILSGTPCLAGSRIPVYLVAEMTWHESVAAAQDTWDLTREQVLAACWFAGAYGTVQLWAEAEDEDAPPPDAYRADPVDPVWLERWRTWAQEAAGAMWAGEYDRVPDPPGANTTG